MVDFKISKDKYIGRWVDNQTMKLGQQIQYNKKTIFLQK